MIKKWIIGTMLVGLTGVLVYGAINRTIARSIVDRGNTSSEARGNGRDEVANGYSEEVRRNDREETANGYIEEVRGNGRGGGRKGENVGLDSDQAVSQGYFPEIVQADDVDWMTLTGEAAGEDDFGLVVLISDGSQIEVSGRAWSYALSQGFSVKVGDRISVTGYYEQPDHLTPGTVVNLTNSQEIQLRDEVGHPMWSGGGGRRDGNG
jgi:hypothetical protein